MIKAILFDLDGTLLDTNELIYESFKYTFNKCFNLKPSKGEITSLYGMPLENSLIDYCKDEEELKRAIQTYRNYNEKIHDNMCFPFKGVEELLINLKEKDIKIGIVTSKREILAKKGMDIAGIIKYMDIIVTPECTKEHKPKGEPALYALKNLNVKPEEAIMVGDSHFDLLCGKNAGCKTCGVKYTALDIKKLEEVNPDYFVESPMEILNLL
ncbi:pyrophosphatase PpaX [Eubacterium multiforme]|uniref:Pyrophosphatase PpaX n=1 Tax=Eubacterium multiforme TaxID=83339 RepID=A0ABT9UQ51_9FIRM|nr:pyrophosphatase PpaX [Eubacterium multiforme]MDQ0148427.1 pyrophosphatase PpaX [Eubacterium multiforme]